MGASAITVNSPLTSNPVTTDPACAPTTPEPVPTICPPTGQADLSGQADPDICQVGTPTPTPTTCPITGLESLAYDAPRCQIGLELLEYNVNADADMNETRADVLLTGVQKTARALCLFSNQDQSDPDSTCDDALQKATFINVMIGNGADIIEITEQREDNCLASPPLGIDCFSGLNGSATEYTYVHELGHIFLYRTRHASPVNTDISPCQTTGGNVAFIGCMERPVGNSQTLGSGPNNTFVFGLRGEEFTQQEMIDYLDIVNPPNDNGDRKYNITATSPIFNYGCRIGGEVNQATGLCDYSDGRRSEEPFVILNDWQRGLDGWDGEIVNGIGACDGTPGYTISNFQQNPCFIPNWLDSTLGTHEQEEAGSDMFLNWVYRTIGQGGFSDNETPPNAPEPYSGGPGDVRFAWMNEQLTKFFDYYGWSGE